MGLGVLFDGLAPTPPMGWNSWNRFQHRVTEEIVRETAEAMTANGMKDAGYEYVVVDDCWEARERDERGNLLSDPVTFPSGIPALAEHVHRLGLKFGIYTDAGTHTCNGRAGSLGYEFRDARAFAEWGVDYVKVDWCHADGLGPRTVYTKWSEAFASLPRRMVLSVCEWGRTRPWEWAGTVGHLWRTTWDIQDTWESMLAILDRQAELHAYAGPGRWNDPDMLEVGNGGMTDVEYRSHFSLWAMLAAPLMAGNDVREMSPAIRDILIAPEIVAVDQDALGQQGRRVKREGTAEVWARPLADGSRAALLFERGSEPARIAVRWDEIGIRGPCAARDLWARKDVGDVGDRYEAEVEPHGVVMLKLRPL